MTGAGAQCPEAKTTVGNVLRMSHAGEMEHALGKMTFSLDTSI